MFGAILASSLRGGALVAVARNVVDVPKNNGLPGTSDSAPCGMRGACMPVSPQERAEARAMQAEFAAQHPVANVIVNAVFLYLIASSFVGLFLELTGQLW
jgi:hypothetical protein